MLVKYPQMSNDEDLNYRLSLPVKEGLELKKRSDGPMSESESNKYWYFKIDGIPMRLSQNKIFNNFYVHVNASQIRSSVQAIFKEVSNGTII